MKQILLHLYDVYLRSEQQHDTNRLTALHSGMYLEKIDGRAPEVGVFSLLLIIIILKFN